MSSPSSPTLDEAIEKSTENVQGDKVEQLENQETTEGVREKTKEMEGDAEGASVFLIEKGAKIFKKTLTKKGFISERGFKEMVQPLKKEIERRGWVMLCKHLEPGRRTLVKELYANLGDKKKLTYYVRGRGCLLEKGSSLNCSSSKKEKTTQNLRSSKRVLTSRRLQRSSLVAKENGRAHEPFPMHTSIEATL